MTLKEQNAEMGETLAKLQKAGEGHTRPPENYCVDCQHHRRSWRRHVCVSPKFTGTEHNPVTGKEFTVKRVKCSLLNDYGWCDGFEAKP